METAMSHYGNWWAVAAWVVLYGVLIAFVPFYKKSQVRPASVYLAFIVAFALEMFGVPLSLYIVAGLSGYWLPEGFLWGHTLSPYIGHWGMYIGLVLCALGVWMVVVGWKQIHQHYWGKERGEGELVTKGIYAYIRHPQYTGFLLVTLGILAQWATIPLLILWPVMVTIYYRLARKEEKEMESEFGQAYAQYKRQTSMFLPFMI